MTQKPVAKEIEAAARAMCGLSGFNPDKVMPNGESRWRLYVPGAEAAIAAYKKAVRQQLDMIFAAHNGGVGE